MLVILALNEHHDIMMALMNLHCHFVCAISYVGKANTGTSQHAQEISVHQTEVHWKWKLEDHMFEVLCEPNQLSYCRTLIL